MNRRVLGAVLAGGRSTRFGSDKAQALLDGRALLDHAASRLAPHVDALLIVGRRHPTYSWTPDRPRAHLGPLGGLCGALAYAEERGYTAVVTVGCDMPLIPEDLVAALASDGPAMVTACPVVGWWPTSFAQALEAHLRAGGDRSIHRWASRIGTQLIEWPSSIANVNTPADLEQLRAGVF